MKLAEALQDCTLALLRRIAAAHGVPAEEDALRAELAGRILQRLAEPGYLAGYLASVPAQEVEVLQAVRTGGWMARAFVLDRRFPRRGDAQPPAGRPDPTPSLSLLHRGLLFRTFAPIGAWHGEVYHVPEELRQEMDKALPAPVPREVADLRARVIPEMIEERDAAFDVFCLLSFLRRADRRLAQGTLSRSDLAKLEREAGGASPGAREGRPPVPGGGPAEWQERWRFLLHLCLAGGWVGRQGATVRPGRGAAGLLSGSHGAVRARLLERYLRDRSWSDLAAAGRVRQPLGGRAIDESAARRLLLHHLEELSGLGWTEERAFCDALRATNPDLLREDYSSPAWAVVHVDSGAELYGPGSWDAVEGEWIRYLLRGPLCWLGVVRWGRTRDGRAVGFQLLAGEFGGLDRPRGGLVGAGASLRLEATERLQVRVPEDADLGIAYRLEPYLEPQSLHNGRSYRLTRASVLAGLERGGSQEELRELLGTCAAEPPGEAALSEVEAWAAAYGRFALDSALLLVAAEPRDADLLAELPGVAPCLGERMGLRAYRVAPERLWELVERLRRAGHPPRLDPGARRHGARSAAADAALLRECLFALLVLRTLPGGPQLEDGAGALRRLETALGPEEVAEVSRRAQEASRGIRGRITTV